MTKRHRLPVFTSHEDVCKPCWELHYCPYGILVEMFPLLPIDRDDGEAPGERAAAFTRILRVAKPPSIKRAEDVWALALTVLAHDPQAHEHAEQFRVEDIKCNFWGHCCPAFFVTSAATETAQGRRWGRQKIPRWMQLQVARRDNYVCQLCRTSLPDYDVHFDHVIPVARGGSTAVRNLRVVCGGCNRKKSKKLDPGFLAPVVMAKDVADTTQGADAPSVRTGKRRRTPRTRLKAAK